LFPISAKIAFSLLILLVMSGCQSARVGGGGMRKTSSYEKQSPEHLQALHCATLRPYTVFGVQYCPHIVEKGQTMEGIASWYGPDFHGKKTSSGEVYNKFALTAAHKTWPMHTVVRVDNLENGKSVIVRINDRGPFLKDRVIDLSYMAAKKIDMHKKGLARVRLTVLETDSKNWPKDAPRGSSTGATRNECHLVQGAFASTQTKTQHSSGSEIFFVQVGSFSTFEAAKRFQHSLNLPLRLDSKIEQSSGLYRVLIGGFANEKEAREFISSSKYSGAFLVRERR